ncbi:MAG: DUF502 domain-containing protein [Thermodesulfobacteriota bacterium]
MVEQLKKSFVAGIFVLLPLWLTAALLHWFFGEVDQLFSPIVDGLVRRVVGGVDHIPGTGILTGLVILLLLGTLARNVAGQRLLDGIDRLIQRVPGFRSVYSAVQQLTNAFSPKNTASFKEVLLVEHPKPGSYAIGFRTMTVEEGGRRLVAAFIPTNHLYLGDVVFFDEEKVMRLDMSVEQAIRLLMSAGIASPREFRRIPPPGAC